MKPIFLAAAADRDWLEKKLWEERAGVGELLASLRHDLERTRMLQLGAEKQAQHFLAERLRAERGLEKLAEVHARMGEQLDLLKQRCRGLQAYGSQQSGAAYEMALQLGQFLEEIDNG